MTSPKEGTVFNVCHWISRATFDVIGVAGMLNFYVSSEIKPDLGSQNLGFGYEFNAIEEENEQVYLAYKVMYAPLKQVMPPELMNR